MKKSLLQLTVLIFLILSVTKNSSQAQITTSKVIPPSPDAAALMKFGDIPVSNYTGTPNINIPLYTINSGDITVPISLAYHASGIKLSEEASSAGLGWALNAGGVVSRTILDKDDFAGWYFSSTLPEIISAPSSMISYMSNSKGYEMLLQNGERKSLFEFLSPSASVGSRDKEPDMFSFNFPGYSGKFIIRRNKEVVLNKQEDIRIEFTLAGESFTITDENGFVYFFNSQEKSLSADEQGSWKTNSWYLSQIQSPTHNKVKFYYKKDAIVSVSGLVSQVDRLGCSVGGLQTSLSPRIDYSNLSIDSIAFDNGYVKFLFENDREDLQGGKKLSRLKVHAYSHATKTSRLIKEYEFQYGYFNENYLTKYPREYRRLKLISLVEKSGAVALPPYRFHYIEPAEINANISLTYKQSSSIDFWGYFNNYANGFNPGNPSLNTYVPKYNGLKYVFDMDNRTVGSQWVDLAGANRDPEPDQMKLFSLKEVIFPTGGKTKFEMEAHDFDPVKSVNYQYGYQDPEQLEVVNIDTMIVISNRGLTQSSLDLSKRYSNNIKVAVTFVYSCSYSLDCISKKNSFGYGNIYFKGLNHNVDIGSLSSCERICTTGLMDTSLPTASIFPFEGYIKSTVDPSFSQIMVRVIWTELRRKQSPSELNNQVYSYAGGLRIKQITDYNTANKIAKTRHYDYHYQEDKDQNGKSEVYSYGRRMSPPSFYRYEVLENTGGGSCAKCMSLTRYSNSIISLSNSAQGSIVGYDKVTEYITNGEVSLGKTEYFYENEADAVYPYHLEGDSRVNIRPPGILNESNNRNGLLLSKIDYALKGSSFKKVKEVTTAYRSLDFKVLYTFRSEDPGGLCNSGFSIFNVFLYPALKSEKTLLDSTVTRIYDQADDTRFVQTIQKHYYDNPAHILPTRVETYTSDGDRLVTVNKYSLDNITGLSNSAQVAKDNLATRHIISPVLEQTIMRNGALVSKTRNNYQVFDTGLVLLGNIELQQGGGPLEKRVEFQQYDEMGNLQQQAKMGDVPLAYLWSYKQALPVAEIKNAGADQVFHTSFEEEGIEDTNAKTGSRIYAGNYIIPVDKRPVAGHYTLTYWERINDQWEFKSREISYNPDNNPVIDTPNSIDEVRLFPPGSQITSYTYRPLIGITSTCDANNQITYYDYDELGRLRLVKDGKGNILNSYNYEIIYRDN